MIALLTASSADSDDQRTRSARLDSVFGTQPKEPCVGATRAVADHADRTIGPAAAARPCSKTESKNRVVKVLDEQGEPLEGIQALWLDPNGNLGCARTNGTGCFSLNERTEISDLMFPDVRVLHSSGDKDGLKVHVDRPPSLTVRVIDASSGEPVYGSTLVLEVGGVVSGANWTKRLHPGGAGRHRLCSVPTGPGFSFAWAMRTENAIDSRGSGRTRVVGVLAKSSRECHLTIRVATVPVIESEKRELEQPPLNERTQWQFETAEFIQEGSAAAEHAIPISIVTEETRGREDALSLLHSTAYWGRMSHGPSARRDVSGQAGRRPTVMTVDLVDREGTPTSGVAIQCSRLPSQRTNAAGVAAFESSSRGVYSFWVDPSVMLVEAVQIDTNLEPAGRVVLREPKSRRLVLRVENRDGTPVRFATVRVGPEEGIGWAPELSNGQQNLNVVTDSNGVATIGSCPDADIQLSIEWASDKGIAKIRRGVRCVVLCVPSNAR